MSNNKITAGAAFPALPVNGLDDSVVDISKAMNDNDWHMVVVYRGRHCPMCTKYLNNLIEQDHRFIKRRIRHMCGFKSFRSASATLDGIEVASMIRKRQFPSNTTSGFQLFAEIAG